MCCYGSMYDGKKKSGQKKWEMTERREKVTEVKRVKEEALEICREITWSSPIFIWGTVLTFYSHYQSSSLSPLSIFHFIIQLSFLPSITPPDPPLALPPDSSSLCVNHQIRPHAEPITTEGKGQVQTNTEEACLSGKMDEGKRKRSGNWRDSVAEGENEPCGFSSSLMRWDLLSMSPFIGFMIWVNIFSLHLNFREQTEPAVTSSLNLIYIVNSLSSQRERRHACPAGYNTNKLTAMPVPVLQRRPVHLAGPSSC